VLTQTAGFLYGDNLLSRFGEWGRGPTALPRRSFNEATLASVRALDPLTKHALSSPFTGAVYDVLVGIFVRHLVALGAIDERLAAHCRHTPGLPVPALGDDFRRAYRGRGRLRRGAPPCAGRAGLAAGRRLASQHPRWPRVLEGAASPAGRRHRAGTGHGALVAQAFAARGIAA